MYRETMNSKNTNHESRSTKILIADNVRSLHNIGSLFRSCDVFGMDALYLCGTSGTPPRKEISKTALGGEERIPWKYFEKTSDALSHAKKEGCTLLGLELSEQSIPISTYTSPKSWALVVGHEILGVSPEVMKQCDVLLQIPILGKKESLNVSVAAGIGLYELTH